MVRTDDVAAVKAFLEKDPIANLNSLAILDELDAQEREMLVDQIEEIKAVLIHVGYINYLYADDLTALEKVFPQLDEFPENFGFSGVKKEIYEAIVEKYEEDWSTNCYLYQMPSSFELPVVKRDYFDSLGPDDVATVDRFYTYRNDSSYIRLRKNILKRPSICVRIDGELRSWLMVHEDGSMGVMYTREEYRQKGYGYELTMEMIRILRSMGRTPYVQIDVNNLPSITLAEKSGFVRMGEVVWFGVKNRSTE